MLSGYGSFLRPKIYSVQGGVWAGRKVGRDSRQARASQARLALPFFFFLPFFFLRPPPALFLTCFSAGDSIWRRLQRSVYALAVCSGKSKVQPGRQCTDSSARRGTKLTLCLRQFLFFLFSSPALSYSTLAYFTCIQPLPSEKAGHRCFNVVSTAVAQDAQIMLLSWLDQVQQPKMPPPSPAHALCQG